MGFTFSIEYQKGQDNAAMNALNWVTSKLDAGTMKSILGRVIVGMTERVDAYNPAVAEADEEKHKQVWETKDLARTAQAHVNLHVTDWVTAQQEDPILMWPQIKLQKPLLSSCGKDTSQSLEHWPSSWVTEKPTWKQYHQGALQAYGHMEG